MKSSRNTTPITLESIVAAAKDQVSTDLAGEAAILHLGSGTYYGLNEVGASVWKMIQEPVPVSRIRDSLLREYAVNPSECERDLLALLDEMAAAKLVELRVETPEQVPAPF